MNSMSFGAPRRFGSGVFAARTAPKIELGLLGAAGGDDAGLVWLSLGDSDFAWEVSIFCERTRT